jgi:hypothetical protein
MCDYAQEFVPDPEELRYGGPQGDDDDEAKRKLEERERKKAEVRARLEEAGRAKKAKKGFLTPERKKKLRKLLMLKAAEDLKQQQLVKEQERQRILKERIIPMPDVEGIDDVGQLQALGDKFLAHIKKVEGEKWELAYMVKTWDHEINELTIAVNDLRGKFVKPSLKKVSKYDNKFKKMAKKPGGAVNFGDNLKKVKKDWGIDELKGEGDKDKEAAPAE